MTASLCFRVFCVSMRCSITYYYHHTTVLILENRYSFEKAGIKRAKVHRVFYNLWFFLLYLFIYLFCSKSLMTFFNITFFISKLIVEMKLQWSTLGLFCIVACSAISVQDPDSPVSDLYLEKRAPMRFGKRFADPEGLELIRYARAPMR